MNVSRLDTNLTRRAVVRGGARLAAAAALAPYRGFLGPGAGAAALRRPDSLPDPSRAAGSPTEALPFDHLVVVMMENHSFDNYLGMLPVRGQPLADGFTFDAAGRPTNANPVPGGHISVFHAQSECQPRDVPGNWNEVRAQIDGGRMDGFARTGVGAPSTMTYWDEPDLPFYYSLARTFTLANRWFCSVPAPTFPNRRFLLAGTAYGEIGTDVADLTDPPPPNGTIFDRLHAHGITWANYTTDLPSTGVIGSVVEKYPLSVVPVTKFFSDARLGTLPSVSFVDPEFGALDELKAVLSLLKQSTINDLSEGLATVGGDEENPQDIQYGESFVASVVDAVLHSPAWPRTLLVWTYDEHGGYYDHVPPPRAIAPDAIPPRPGVIGGYDLYGPRVPAGVVSPFSRPRAVTNVVHDHTSILATIEAKWNLPACTFRDANAATLADFLDLRRPAFLEPPRLAAPAGLLPGILGCSNADPARPVSPDTPPSSGRARPRLLIRYYGRRHAVGGLVLELQSNGGVLVNVTVELHHAGRVVAKSSLRRVGTHRHRLVLRARGGRRFVRGKYTLVARSGQTMLQRRSVHVG